VRAYQVKRFLRSTGDPRPYTHLWRMVHYFNYTHVAERRQLSLEPGVFLSPTISFSNSRRISIGAGSHIGAGCLLWAGRISGRITLGRHALLGPGVVMTASNYDIDAGSPVMDQATIERDILVGDDVWLGARVIVLAGVTIGDGAVVGAGSVVTHDLPAGAVAVGNPARVLRFRTGWSAPDAAPDSAPAGGTEPRASPA